MLIIKTQPHNIFSFERLKGLFTSFKKGSRGPIAVLSSLERGLRELKTPYAIDIQPEHADDILHVISSPQAVREGIELKLERKIKKLIVGPTVAISPLDYGKLLCHPAIDTIIVPSAWVRDFYISEAPTLKNKIKVWASGVSDPGEPPVSRSKRQQVLVYQKNAPEELLNALSRELDDQGIPFTIIHYGFFKQEDYFRQLHSSAVMIYLSESESQGLALHEAWIRDVPTLVWNRGYWQYDHRTWQDPKISAPYLTDICGYFFKDSKEFKIKFNTLTEQYKKLRPREYSLLNFTDTISARKYLTIVNS